VLALGRLLVGSVLTIGWLLVGLVIVETGGLVLAWCWLGVGARLAW
jgi:hypothetical protein